MHENPIVHQSRDFAGQMGNGFCPEGHTSISKRWIWLGMVGCVHIYSLTAPVFGTNCYLVSAGEAGPCVIVDPGGGVADDVRSTVRRLKLEPVAVLATHGHVDHTWSAGELTREYGVALHVHDRDAYRLQDPFGSLERPGTGGSGLVQSLTSGPLGAALAASGCAPQDYQEPAQVESFLPDGAAVSVLELGGLSIRATHAPGHTEGSTLFLFDGVPSQGSSLPSQGNRFITGSAAEGTGATALTGDVLFAGTIGRTDLPGGDGATMAQTLRDVVGKLADHTLVLPGHGPASRMREEKMSNPFLVRR